MIRALLVAIAVVLLPTAALAQQPPDDDAPTIDPDADPDAPDQPDADQPDADQPNPDQPAGGDGTGAPGDAEPPDTGPELITSQPPPDRWQTYSVAGDLLEPAAQVEALLAQRMQKAQVLNETSERELREFCADQLGYALTRIKKTRDSGGALHATLELKPLYTVYKVDVDVDNLPDRFSFSGYARAFFESVFSDQVRRRMRLRQGSHLDLDPRVRARIYLREKLRIEEFFKNEGYFEARATVDDHPFGDHGLTVDVEVKKGPRYQVGAVRVVGAEAIAPDEIENRFKHSWVCFLVCIFEGGFTREQLTKDVQSVVGMYHGRGYPGARVRTDFDTRTSFNRDSKTVEFTVFVTERRRVDVVFQGNDKKKSPDDQLRKELTFADEGSYDDIEIRSSAEAIRRYYQAKGHFEASIATERIPFGVFERIIFSIDEGPRLPVKEVTFVGNEHVPDGDLRSLVKTRKFERVALFGGGGGFVTTLQLDQDVARIIDLYRRRGYWQVKVRARVARDRVVQDNAAALAAAVAGQLEAEGLYVRFIVEEGPRQKVARVDVDMANRFQTLSAIRDPDEKAAKQRYFERERRNLLGQLRLHAGDAFHATKLRDDLSKLVRYEFGRGYPHAAIEARVCPKLDPDARYDCPDGGDPNALDITWVVDEKQPITVGAIAVRGNFHTSNWVILDELGLGSGDRLTLARAERAQQNLRTTGLFNTVNVNYVDFDDKTLAEHNIVVTVQERQRWLAEAGAGYSTDSGEFIEGALTHRNVLGIGLKPDLRLHWGRDLKAAEAKLALPRWIGRRMSGGLIAFNTETAAFYRRESTERFGLLESFGTSLSLAKAGQYGVFRGWVGAIRYDIRARFRDVDLIRPAGAAEDLKSSKVPTVTGSIGPQLIIDRRTDRDGRPQPLLPEKGWRVEGHVSYADPILSQPVRLVRASPGRDRFIKVGGSGQLFWKPSPRTLISNGLRYDHGIPLGGEYLLPEVERFFAGGDTTVRGFEEDRLAIEVIEEPLPPLGTITQLRILPAGGNIRLIHNLDFQLEVWSILGFPVTSAIFFDTGLVTNSLDGFGIKDLRHAIGAALFRWTLPVGALSLEYAVPLDPNTGDNPRGRFHFNLGLAF